MRRKPRPAKRAGPPPSSNLRSRAPIRSLSRRRAFPSPRTVTLKITFKPDESRTLIASKAVVTTNLQPQEPQTIPVVLDKLDGAPMLFESFTDNRPDQYRFDGTSPTELRGNGNVTVNVTPFKKAEEHPINQ